MPNCGVLVDSLTQFTADVIKFAAAETRYYEVLSRGGGGGGGCRPPPTTKDPAPNGGTGLSALSQQIAYAREQIASSLKKSSSDTTTPSSSSGGVANSDDIKMREENLILKKQLELLQGQVNLLTERVKKLETNVGGGNTGGGDSKKAAPAANDDDVDLFGSDEEEDTDAAAIREQRLAEYAAKKSNKAKIIAKSNVILDVKPWDDETDMKELEKCVRSIVQDGLLWGVSKLVPLAYGIKKLQITSVVEDDKVSIEELTEKLESFEDYIQSVDIAAFNKI